MKRYRVFWRDFDGESDSIIVSAPNKVAAIIKVVNTQNVETVNFIIRIGSPKSVALISKLLKEKTNERSN